MDYHTPSSRRPANRPASNHESRNRYEKPNVVDDSDSDGSNSGAEESTAFDLIRSSLSEQQLARLAAASKEKKMEEQNGLTKPGFRYSAKMKPKKVPVSNTVPPATSTVARQQKPPSQQQHPKQTSSRVSPPKRRQQQQQQQQQSDQKQTGGTTQPRNFRSSSPIKAHMLSESNHSQQQRKHPPPRRSTSPTKSPVKVLPPPGRSVSMKTKFSDKVPPQQQRKQQSSPALLSQQWKQLPPGTRLVVTNDEQTKEPLLIIHDNDDEEPDLQGSSYSSILSMNSALGENNLHGSSKSMLSLNSFGDNNSVASSSSKRTTHSSSHKLPPNTQQKRQMGIASNNTNIATNNQRPMPPRNLLAQQHRSASLRKISDGLDGGTWHGQSHQQLQRPPTQPGPPPVRNAMLMKQHRAMSMRDLHNNSLSGLSSLNNNNNGGNLSSSSLHGGRVSQKQTNTLQMPLNLALDRGNNNNSNQDDDNISVLSASTANTAATAPHNNSGRPLPPRNALMGHKSMSMRCLPSQTSGLKSNVIGMDRSSWHGRPQQQQQNRPSFQIPAGIGSNRLDDSSNNGSFACDGESVRSNTSASVVRASGRKLPPPPRNAQNSMNGSRHQGIPLSSGSRLVVVDGNNDSVNKVIVVDGNGNGNRPAVLVSQSSNLSSQGANGNKPAVLVSQSSTLSSQGANGNKPAALVTQSSTLSRESVGRCDGDHLTEYFSPDARQRRRDLREQEESKRKKQRCFGICCCIIVLLVIAGAVLAAYFLGFRPEVPDKVKSLIGDEPNGVESAPENPEVEDPVIQEQTQAPDIVPSNTTETDIDKVVYYCNGLTELCDQRIDDVLFAGVHNAANSKKETSVSPVNHELSLEEALVAGFRGINLQFGMCNGLLTLVDGTCSQNTHDPIVSLSAIIKFLQNNPSEVLLITSEIKDGAGGGTVTMNDIGKLFDSIPGWNNLLFKHPEPGYAWPKLQRMIDQNQRILFFVYGGFETCTRVVCPSGIHDWFQYATETAKDFDSFATVQDEAKSCVLVNGQENQQDFYSINLYPKVPSKEYCVQSNAAEFLEQHLQKCSAITGQKPNLIMADCWNVGDLLITVSDYNTKLPQVETDEAYMHLNLMGVNTEMRANHIDTFVLECSRFFSNHLHESFSNVECQFISQEQSNNALKIVVEVSGDKLGEQSIHEEALYSLIEFHGETWKSNLETSSDYFASLTDIVIEGRGQEDTGTPTANTSAPAVVADPTVGNGSASIADETSSSLTQSPANNSTDSVSVPNNSDGSYFGSVSVPATASATPAPSPSTGSGGSVALDPSAFGSP